MKNPKNKEEYFELVKKQPSILLLVGLLMLVLSVVIKYVGIVLMVVGGVWTVYRVYDENKKKEKKKDDTKQK